MRAIHNAFAVLGAQRATEHRRTNYWRQRSLKPHVEAVGQVRIGNRIVVRRVCEPNLARFVRQVVRGSVSLFNLSGSQRRAGAGLYKCLIALEPCPKHIPLLETWSRLCKSPSHPYCMLSKHVDERLARCFPSTVCAENHDESIQSQSAQP